MKTFFARRLFRALLTISLINVGITLMVLEFVYEDMEETILRQELSLERRFLEERITEARARTWNTALLNAVYIPDGDEEFELPSLFQGREIPFSAEVELERQTFLISIERTAAPPGVLYIAQEISLMENREDALQLGLGLFALFALGMVLLLARIGTRRIVGPLEDLANEIARVRPGTLYTRIQTSYADAELANIADTLNQLLDELDAYVQREKSLVSLASHELRTPLAVISGALDVLEQRDSLGEADRRTVARIRRAADEMRIDVQTLLKLARRSSEHDQREAVDLAASVHAVIADLSGKNPALKERIECVWPAQPPAIHADPALVRMLLRNLVQNAVRHTTGQVRIELGPHSLNIIDAGEGLPEHIRARLSDPQNRQIPEDGLGLFIVRLICERLGWLLQVRRGDSGGTIFNLLFLPDTARVTLSG